MSGVQSQQSAEARGAPNLNTNGEAIAMCFSGGKDSSLALWETHRARRYVVRSFLTTVNADFDRVSMHGVRRSLLREQSRAIGIPMTEVAVPRVLHQRVYEREMGHAFARLQASGIRRVAFGDIFLEDLRTYRENQLAAWNLKCFFPLWNRTPVLARRFIRDGFEAVIVLNLAVLAAAFAGRRFDAAFWLISRPASHPCGENGESSYLVAFSHGRSSAGSRVCRSPGEVPSSVNDFAFCDPVPRSVLGTRQCSQTSGG